MNSKRRDHLSKLRNYSCIVVVSLFVLLSAGGALTAQTYQKPPQAVLDVLGAPVPPGASHQPEHVGAAPRGDLHRAHAEENFRRRGDEDRSAAGREGRRARVERRRETLRLHEHDRRRHRTLGG
ncbi:MAG: hypothetical protein LC802_06640 [Acidobacteria bacterium]|nr:hypothetical protein [Acidobacteriota bacterium]